jgi:hypothetical protein
MQGAPEGKQGPLSRTCHIGFTRDKLDEGSPSRASYQVTRYGRLSEPPADGSIETYPGRRFERIAINIESPGAAPGWHHDAVEVNVFVAVMGDAPSSVIALLPDRAT